MPEEDTFRCQNGQAAMPGRFGVSAAFSRRVPHSAANAAGTARPPTLHFH